jgi:hypothetical protein
MQASGLTRPTLYRHLEAHAAAGRAVQIGGGRWRSAKLTATSSLVDTLRVKRDMSTAFW